MEIDIEVPSYEGIYLRQLHGKAFECTHEVLHGAIGRTVNNTQGDGAITI